MEDYFLLETIHWVISLVFFLCVTTTIWYATHAVVLTFFLAACVSTIGIILVLAAALGILVLTSSTAVTG